VPNPWVCGALTEPVEKHEVDLADDLPRFLVFSLLLRGRHGRKSTIPGATMCYQPSLSGKCSRYQVSCAKQHKVARESASPAKIDLSSNAGRRRDSTGFQVKSEASLLSSATLAPSFRTVSVVHSLRRQLWPRRRLTHDPGSSGAPLSYLRSVKR
jgi:hypothetical protein